MKIKVSVGDFQLGSEEKEAIMEVINKGRISEGSKVREFEKNFADYVGTKYSIALSSGTAALMAGLTALKYKDNGIRPITKIITTPLTYIATSNAIVTTGFQPVYVDVDPETFGITPDAIKEHLENVDNINEYSLILPVHLMGYPCDMDEINRIAEKFDLLTFEDSAQAHGTTYKGKKTGSLSLLSDFSFYIAHNIQAGEMGAITSNDPDIIRMIRKIKANGRMCDCLVCTRAEGKCPRISKNINNNDDFDPRFTHDYIGYNFKTMEFQAALGITQLRKADWITRKRLENVKYLNDQLEVFSDKLQLPSYSENVSYLAYPIVIKRPDIISRKHLRAELEKQGVETRPLFGSIPTQQPAYQYLRNDYNGKLPEADYIGLNGFYIGCHQYLKQEDLEFVVHAFRSILT